MIERCVNTGAEGSPAALFSCPPSSNDRCPVARYHSDSGVSLMYTTASGMRSTKGSRRGGAAGQAFGVSNHAAPHRAHNAFSSWDVGGRTASLPRHSGCAVDVQVSLGAHGVWYVHCGHVPQRRRPVHLNRGSKWHLRVGWRFSGDGFCVVGCRSGKTVFSQALVVGCCADVDEEVGRGPTGGGATFFATPAESRRACCGAQEVVRGAHGRAVRRGPTATHPPNYPPLSPETRRGGGGFAPVHTCHGLTEGGGGLSGTSEQLGMRLNAGTGCQGGGLVYM